jgi:hypothetical protein
MNTPEKKVAPEAGGTEVAGEPTPKRTSPWPRVIVAIFTLGILAAIAIPNYLAATRRSGHRACPANMKTLEGAMEMWLMDQGVDQLPRLEANPGPLLLESQYIQVWPRCPNVPREEESYALRSRGPGRPPEVACRYHGSLTEYLARLR